MKFINYLLCIVLALILAYGFVTLGDIGKDVYVLDEIDIAIIEELESTPYTTYYSQLNDNQKRMYAALYQSVAKGSSKIKFKNVNVEEFKRDMPNVARALQFDHPELFWFAGGYDYIYNRFKKESDVIIKPVSYAYASKMYDYEAKLNELNARVEEVALLASEHSSDMYERMVFVHDYLIENAVYDNAALEGYTSAANIPSQGYIFSAYGCLVNGKTVCSGYAKAYQLIMYELGYDCTYVSGEAGESHGWNCVYIDGEGYFVDVTWDDYDYEDEVPLYNYAFITNEMLEKTHTIKMPFETTFCDNKEYNYFVKNGYYVENYSFETVANILSKQKNNECAYIKFALDSDYQKAMKDLFNDNGLAEIDGMKNAVSYLPNNNQNTITIFLENK